MGVWAVVPSANTHVEAAVDPVAHTGRFRVVLNTCMPAYLPRVPIPLPSGEQYPQTPSVKVTTGGNRGGERGGLAVVDGHGVGAVVLSAC